MPSSPLKFAFYSLDATGHLNSTIGIAQALQSRGHSVIFLSNSVLTGRLESLGFKVFSLQQTTAFGSEKATENPARDYAKLFKESGHLGNESSVSKILKWADRSEKSLLHKNLLQSIDFQPQMEEICRQEGPISCFIADHAFYQPFLAKLGIPWISIISVAPQFLYDNPDLPPAFSGYTEADRPKWAEFRAAQAELTSSWDSFQQQLNRAFNFTPQGGEYKRNCFYNISPLLNLYQYPEELDYPEEKAKVNNLCSMDAFIRHEPEVFEIPEVVKPDREVGEKLVFLSMGSMGSFNVELMKKLTGTLAKSKHKFIVSKGPLGCDYELPANMWGEDFLPQTKILPLVDLVITHGGNNSLTESFSFGCKMIVMPMFADQYDNAQRVHETGYGLRIDLHEHQPGELLEAVEKLLNDEELTARLKTAKERIQSSNSKEKACERIEQAVREFHAGK